MSHALLSIGEVIARRGWPALLPVPVLVQSARGAPPTRYTTTVPDTAGLLRLFAAILRGTEAQRHSRLYARLADDLLAPLLAGTAHVVIDYSATGTRCCATTLDHIPARAWTAYACTDGAVAWCDGDRLPWRGAWWVEPATGRPWLVLPPHPEPWPPDWERSIQAVLPEPDGVLVRP